MTAPSRPEHHLRVAAVAQVRDHGDVEGQARREAVTVEIAYAVLPSAGLVIAAVVAGAVIAWAFDLRGAAWGVVGALGFVVVAVAALVRAMVVLVRARRRGL